MRPVAIGSLALLLATLGCTPTVSMAPGSTFSAPKHVIDSNVAVNEISKTVVGNPILRVKDYWVTTQKSDSMTPSSGFIFKGGPNSLAVVDGQKLKITGETTVAGKTHKILQIPGNTMALLVDAQTGALSPKVLNGIGTFSGGTIMLWNFQSNPANITFASSNIETIASSETYVNYEFIYSGKTGNSISFLYREYTAQDLARPAFSQTVSYDMSEKLIQFKNIKLEVVEVGSSAISVKVLSL